MLSNILLRNVNFKSGSRITRATCHDPSEPLSALYSQRSLCSVRKCLLIVVHRHSCHTTFPFMERAALVLHTFVFHFFDQYYKYFDHFHSSFLDRHDQFSFLRTRSGKRLCGVRLYTLTNHLRLLEGFGMSYFSLAFIMIATLTSFAHPICKEGVNIMIMVTACHFSHSCECVHMESSGRECHSAAQLHTLISVRIQPYFCVAVIPCAHTCITI